MKLGIITFHRAKNYGAVMQTYALNKVTKNLGIDSEVIDYRYNKIENDYAFFKSKNAKKILKDIINYPLKKGKWKKFDRFIEKNINLSEKVYREAQELEEANKIYDCYLTGSDQVFNLKMTGNDENYFLHFADSSKKKNSYAASFGQKEIPKDKEEIYKTLLSDFHSISIREKDAIKIVNELTDKNPRIDVDPSFLLDKNEWEKVSLPPKEKGKYIVLFVMQKNQTIFKFTEDLSAKTGYPIIFITDGYKKYLKAKHKMVVSPEEWLGYFLHAEYIVTNSFHGLAFAVNFNKKFFVELQKPPATGNSRLETILQEYQLQNRMIKNGTSVAIDQDIDWDFVNQELDKNKKQSLNYLKGLKNE
jgi:hypothetical protein